MTDRVAIKSDKAPAPIGPYSQAIKLTNPNELVFLSGQIALIPETGEMVKDGVRAEALQVMKNLDAVLSEAGLTWENVCKAKIFLTDMNDFSAVNEVYAQFAPNPAPARAAIAVKGLPKGALVEIELIAAR